MAALAALSINLAAVGTARAAAPQDSASRRAAKVKEKVSKLSREPRVEVKLTDGTKLKGNVAESDEEGFMLLDEKGGRTRVAYSQVASVRRFRKRSTGKDMAVFGGIMGTIFTVIAVGVGMSK